MKSPGVAVFVSLISLASSDAQTLETPPPTVAPAAFGAVYALDQFGSVKSPADAETAFRKASEDIIAAGGGVLVIPDQTAANWKPVNNTQEQWRKPAPPANAKAWGPGAGVTVVDGRGGTVKVLPPQSTGIVISRTLDLPHGESLPHWGYYPMLSLKNTVLHGSTSYHDWLQEDVPAGTDRRFYVATIRGIFPGEFLNGLTYSAVPRLYVKSLGYDKEKKAWFFVADTEVDVKKGAILSNKNHVNVLDMETFSHNENQTFDVRMWRHNYSQGDNYLFDARFKYMGDVHSTAGDENGVLYAAFVEAETKIFRGKVESWNPATSELKYNGSQGDTLGSGRPFINMNPAKWITAGNVMMVRPASWTSDDAANVNPVFHGKTYPTTVEKNAVGVNALKMGGLIRFSADAPVTDEVVGRYFTVDEKDECIPNSNIHRWFLIDSLTKNADGTKDLRIVRHWWGAKSAGSMTLYKPESYSWDGHEKPLHYIIAPGANAYDVSEGVNNPKRTVKLVPTSFSGTDTDFAAGDAVEQAIGPDPFKPVSFRSWLWDVVPGAFPAPVIDIANNGAVMRDSLFWVHGGSDSYDKETATRYDRNPAWDQLIEFSAVSNTGIKFAADTGNAAILFTQPNDRVQPIKWYYGTEKDAPPKVASLTVTRDTGELNFAGGGARFDGPVTATGLSADKQAARNLRGKNVVVPAGQSTAEVTFAVEEADDNYAVFVEQNWLGNRAIVKKGAKGFTVQFEKPAPNGATLDWMIVR